MHIPQQIIVSKLRGKKRHFAFDMGTHGTAGLVYEKLFCQRAVAAINDLKWNFQRKGFWKNKIEIIGQQSPYTKTYIECSSWTQKLTVRAEDNNTYQLKSNGFWKRGYGWYDSSGQKIIDIQSKPLSRKNRGIITLLQPMRRELLWLMILGWYQIAYYEESAAAVSVLR
jgi:hypothetical protein